MPSVPAKKYYSFMIDLELADALKRIKERDGIAESEQIRRGIRMWLKSKGDRAEIGARSKRGRNS